MSTAEQWAAALEGAGGQGFTLRFEALGLEARCRELQAGEVEECRRMGGERGLRYALYLACDQLREAGERLRRQGELASAFDITQRMRYGDVTAAGAAVLRRSGAEEARVSLQERDGGFLPLTAPGGVWMEPGRQAAAGEDAARLPQSSDGWDARELADRLWMAAGNR